MARWTIEGAELAIDGAHVRVVDVPVHEIGDLALRMHGQAALMRSLHQGVERCIFVENNGFSGGEAEVG